MKRFRVTLLVLLVVIVSLGICACGQNAPVNNNDHQDNVDVEYLITFNTQGGSDIAEIRVVEGGIITLPNDPAKLGYFFGGWYLDATCKEKYDFEKAVESDLTLYAKWRKDGDYNPTLSEEESYQIKFDTQGGNVIDTIKVKKDALIIMPVNPTKTGYAFDGWYLDDELSERFVPTNVLTGDIVLYAKWNCLHVGAKWVDRMDACCNKEGVLEHYECKECKNNLDAEYNEIDDLTIAIIPNAHEYGKWNEEVESTCIKDGALGHYACLLCEKHFDKEYNEISDIKIPATHNYNEEGICADCGYFETGLEFVLASDGKGWLVSGIGTYSGAELEIPAVNYDAKPVTGISSQAFYGCSNLKSIIIPQSVVNIGSYALSNCPELESIIVDPKNPVYHSSGNCLIKTDNKILVAGCKASIIPNDGSVSIIGGNAFYGCSGLSDITIPDKVTTIYYSAFYNCTGLTNVNIPNSVLYIDAMAFVGCSSLVSVTIPLEIKGIGNSAFYGCSSLATVNWNAKNCAVVGEKAYPIFNGCDALTTIYIGKEVVAIPENVFVGCDNIAIVNWYATACLEAGSFEYPVFSGCDRLTTLNVGKDVSVFPTNVLKNCANFNAVKINDIEQWCAINFYGNPLNEAHNLYLNDELVEELVIPNGVTAISSYAFLGCSSITKITIPNSVVEIGNYVFSNCTALKSAEIGVGVTDIGIGAFAGCASLTSISVPQNVKTIAQSAFKDCSSLSSVEWNAVECVKCGYSAYPIFSGCDKLTEITIGGNVTALPANMFYGCENLEKVTFKNANGWYVTANIEDFNGKINGMKIDLSNATSNATCAKSIYVKYYWYMSQE